MILNCIGPDSVHLAAIEELQAKQLALDGRYAEAKTLARHAMELYRKDLGDENGWVANILLYIPLAFALTGAVVGHARSLLPKLFGAVLAAVSCIGLAFAVEFAQLFFPPRTVSQNDLIAETIGTLIGVVAWLVAGERLLGLWHRFRTGGAHAWRAVLVL